MFETMEDFLHVTAHEINHLFVGQMLAPEGIKPEDFFLQNFAFEGLAVHYNNNLKTLYKDKKYDDDITYGMVVPDMEFYERNFDKIFEMIKADYYACRGKQLEEVTDLVSSHYEIFEFMGKKFNNIQPIFFDVICGGLMIYDMARKNFMKLSKTLNYLFNYILVLPKINIVYNISL